MKHKKRKKKEDEYECKEGEEMRRKKGPLKFIKYEEKFSCEAHTKYKI